MDYKIKEETLSGIADAIRSKSGSSETIKVSEFAEQIGTISTGPDIELLENLPITVNFSSGNQLITAPEGTAVKSAVIQKPGNLVSENIAEGIDIAGVIGALPPGLNLVYKYVKFNGTGNIQTVTHDLGVVPDIAILECKIGPNNFKNWLMHAYGFSAAFRTLVGGINVAINYFYTNSSGAYAMGSNPTGIDNTSSSFILNNANKSTIVIGNSSYKPYNTHSYGLLVIGGLTKTEEG